ncbi:TauD/TfdA family dioxygenase [Streptomyces sp. NPDC051920]|uniref:TauD/TfdA dioxygenase family protein n=1 Tax=Streptomyces sp. NPDC051920 TaxID=3155523 RepID=UPI00342F2E5E
MNLNTLVNGPRRLERPDVDGFKHITVRPRSTTIGAEIEDVRLSDPIEDDVAEELRRALREWKVIFFRDQELTPQRHLEVAGLWGEPEVNPFFPMGDQAAISRLAREGQMSGRENLWHSDHSFLAEPARGSMLRAIEIPAYGGDTMWCDMHAAYENLPDDIKSHVDGLEAEHDWIHSWGRAIPAEKRDELRKTLPAVVHPVVKVHPDTGRRTLYVNEGFTQRILGLSKDESHELLRYLRLQARVPEYQVRFRWAPNSVAIWDNWAAQHYALSDYQPQRRVMERVAISGAGWNTEG